MGNETSGFAVLNLSGYNLHMGLSMAATHYYENNVNHGEIFYRWPGAVYYTVYAQIAPELSDGICAGEAGVANYTLIKDVSDVLDKVDAADLCAKKMGCYGGGSGTWLVLRGGLKRVDGHLKHEKLRLVKEKPEYILANGKFTSHSLAKFYTTAGAKKHRDAGHCCRRATCNMLS